MSIKTNEEKSGVVHSTQVIFGKILESRTSSNILIIVLILLAALPLFGVGIMTTSAAAPQDIEDN